jgi:integrase
VTIAKKRNRDRRPDESSFRFDRVLTGVRITRRSGTREWRQFEQDNSILTELAKQGQESTLKRFAKGEIDMPQLRAAHSRGQLSSASLLSDMAVREPLWDSMTATFPRMGRSQASRDRYEVSMKSLQRKAGHWLSTKATVADLEAVDWNTLSESWGTSGSDWNRLRAMLSSFLTKLLGDKFHPLRRAILAKIPSAPEIERTCAITVEQFWQIVASVPAEVQPMFVTLVATGARWGEYLRLTRDDLNGETFAVRLVGETTRKNAKKRARTIYVAEWLWPWVMAAVPAPLAYKATRKHWKRACAAHEAPDVRIHDLRHLKGQVAIRGAALSEVADVLGHTQLSTTRRYVRDLNQERVAKVVGKGLKPKGKILPMPRAAGGSK